MAFTPYHNIVAGTAKEVELISVDDLSISRKVIKNIHFTNLHDHLLANIDLYLYKPSTDTTSEETYYILHNYPLNAGAYITLNNEYLLKFDNSTYRLFVKVGASNTIDILIGT